MTEQEVLAYLLTPSHGSEMVHSLAEVSGAYYRAGRYTWVPCACRDCQEAHRLANRTAESPFHQGQIARMAGVANIDDGLVIVGQTNEEFSRVAIYRPDESMPWSYTAVHNNYLDIILLPAG